MSVYIIGKRNEGWQVCIRGSRFVTRSHLLTKAQAISLAAYVLSTRRKEAA